MSDAAYFFGQLARTCLMEGKEGGEGDEQEGLAVTAKERCSSFETRTSRSKQLQVESPRR